jgi:hypothetical protein
MDIPEPDLRLASGHWLATLAARDKQALDELSADHASYFADGDDTLLVSFQLWSPSAQHASMRAPFGLDLAQARGWSSLTVLARQADWFRAPVVAEFLDAQTDAGFFDSYRRIMFIGAGMGGYAACAFSAAAPGASVLAIAPQATLDPAIAGWDARFPSARRLDFTDRYGFAPAMLDAAQQAVILYDPRHQLDAMHATLFLRPNATVLRLPDLGAQTLAGLVGLGLLDGLVDLWAEGDLTPASCARLMRARRSDPDWLARLVQTCLDAGQPARALLVAEHALAHQPCAQNEALVRGARNALCVTLP